MTVFAVRLKVLRLLLDDPLWFEKALRSKNLEELQRVFVEFGRAKGISVIEVPLK